MYWCIGVIIAMEEYFRDRGKYRAIAIYTFNSINCRGEHSVSTRRLRDALKATLTAMACAIEEREVDRIIDDAARGNKTEFELEDFCSVFEKAFTLMCQYLP